MISDSKVGIVAFWDYPIETQASINSAIFNMSPMVSIEAIGQNSSVTQLSPGCELSEFFSRSYWPGYL